MKARQHRCHKPQGDPEAASDQQCSEPVTAISHLIRDPQAHQRRQLDREQPSLAVAWVAALPSCRSEAQALSRLPVFSTVPEKEPRNRYPEVPLRLQRSRRACQLVITSSRILALFTWRANSRRSLRLIKPMQPSVPLLAPSPALGSW